MYNHIKDARLKDGTNASVGIVNLPDADWKDQLVGFLSHKGFPYVWHMVESFDGKVDSLEVRCYVITIGNKVISNISTFEFAGRGIFGHVFTKPEYRQKGCAGIIMDVLTDDFKKRGGKALYLHTGYGSVAYKLYSKYGFNPFYEGRGDMEFLTDSCFYETISVKDNYSIRDVMWKDWPGVCVLTSMPSADYLRSIFLDVYGRKTVEGSFQTAKKRHIDGELVFKVAVAENGTILGFAICGINPLWDKNGDNFLIDAMCIRDRPDIYTALINSVIQSGKRHLIFSDTSNADRNKAIEKCGFKNEAKLKETLKDVSGKKYDLVICRRD